MDSSLPDPEAIGNIAQPQIVMGLSFFPTAEGFYDYQNKKYIYQYKDQIGNVRLSYARNATTNELEIIDRNDYYPFGLNILQGAEFSVNGSPLNYKFGGKELQETGMYDFGARNYMPDVGRWFGADPMAELSPDLSPYRYAFNNPISFTDPDGMYEDDYGGGDYYDDSDREPDFELPHFNTDLCSCNSILENIEKIFDGSAKVDFSFGYGGESGDGAYNDFMEDMRMENGSNDMMNDANPEVAPPPFAGSENGYDENRSNNIDPGDGPKPSYTPPPKTLPAFPDAKPNGQRNGRKQWKDPNGTIYEWDGQHGEVEVYDKRGKHQGAKDPNTGEWNDKPAKPGRNFKPMLNPRVSDMSQMGDGFRKIGIMIGTAAVVGAIIYMTDGAALLAF